MPQEKGGQEHKRSPQRGVGWAGGRGWLWASLDKFLGQNQGKGGPALDALSPGWVLPSSPLFRPVKGGLRQPHTHREVGKGLLPGSGRNTGAMAIPSPLGSWGGLPCVGAAQVLMVAASRLPALGRFMGGWEPSSSAPSFALSPMRPQSWKTASIATGNAYRPQVGRDCCLAPSWPNWGSAGLQAGPGAEH